MLQIKLDSQYTKCFLIHDRNDMKIGLLAKKFFILFIFSETGWLTDSCLTLNGAGLEWSPHSSPAVRPQFSYFRSKNTISKRTRSSHLLYSYFSIIVHIFRSTIYAFYNVHRGLNYLIRSATSCSVKKTKRA